MAVLNLTFAGENWIGPAIALAGLGLVILIWGYWSQTTFSLRWVCGALKFLGIAALAFCLLDPLRSGRRVRPGANLFAIVADNSEGLQIKDPGETLNRGERLRKWLTDSDPDWQARLAENFDVRRYLFDARLQGVSDFNELTFDGRSSAIGAALHTLADRMKDRPLAGVLLFTDGNATDLAGSLPDLQGLPPVYPVVVGRKDAVKDISLSQVSVSQSDFEDQPVRIQAEASAPGFHGEPLVARLQNTDGKIVEEQKLTVRGTGDSVPFRLEPKPEKPGLTFYELQVLARPDAAADRTTGNSPEEATLANNSRVLAVDRGGGPFRILYVSGRPNWEYKFLNRSLEEDRQLQLVGLIRVAKREPKFEFRGRAGETSNPLFRGFGNQAPEEVERYDQPVLVRLNTRDELELRSGFPRTPEDLYGYHAVVLDDVEAAFFAPEQAVLLQKFVSERGGGLLMLGGMESFREGGYYRTPIGEMLPVYLDRAEPARPGDLVRFDLAREGWLQPWARLRDREDAERQRIEEMPPFQVANRVRSVKPGASIIATAKDNAGEVLPALVVQRFGRGRTGAMLVGDFWRWGMRNPAARSDMEKSWRQIMRWLVSEVPKQVELTVEPVPADPLGAVHLEVRVRDAKFQPLDNASVSVEVDPVQFAGAPAATNVMRFRADPSPTEAGLYRATYLPRTAGGFRATASVTNDVGASVGQAEAGWANNPAADEFRSLVPNTALLEAIARKTGGEIVQASELSALADRLPLKAATFMEAWTYPFWHNAWMFALALGCFVAEWGIRRWKGLP